MEQPEQTGGLIVDDRGRLAIKRYRNIKSKDGEVKYITVSLTLDIDLVSFLNKKVMGEDDKNMSRFIEEHVNSFMKKSTDPIPLRRPYGTKPQKKTFTFTREFVTKIDKRGKRSFFIETMLKREFGF